MLPAFLFSAGFQQEAKTKRRQRLSLKKQLSWCRQAFQIHTFESHNSFEFVGLRIIAEVVHGVTVLPLIFALCPNRK